MAVSVALRHTGAFDVRLLRLADDQDLMAADVRAEIDAAPHASDPPKGAGDESH